MHTYYQKHICFPNCLRRLKCLVTSWKFNLNNFKKQPHKIVGNSYIIFLVPGRCVTKIQPTKRLLWISVIGRLFSFHDFNLLHQYNLFLCFSHHFLRPFSKMKPLYLFIPLLQFASNVVCIRNLFLPRTGDISGITSSAITENLSNVTNFESLLGAGRSLAYPFSAGMLLAITTLANENNWKVSDAGYSKVLGIPQEEILESYGTLLEILEGVSTFVGIV